VSLYISYSNPTSTSINPYGYFCLSLYETKGISLFLTRNTNTDLQAYFTPGKFCTLDNWEGPTVNDASLKVEIIYAGLKYPVTMAFLGDDTRHRMLGGTNKGLSHPVKINNRRSIE
jgi:hypothetical protein